LRIEQLLNPVYLSGFSSVRSINFVQNSYFQVHGRNTIPLVWKSLVWEAGWTITFFPMRIELPFEGNTVYVSGFSSVRNINTVQKSSVQMYGKTNISLVRYSSMLESGGLAHCFFWELSLFMKWILATSQGFSLWSISFDQNSPIHVNRRSILSLARKRRCQKLEGHAHCFPLTIKLPFES
jgi:hypothetical protein